MKNNSKIITAIAFLALFSADALAFDPHEALRQREISRYEFLGRDQGIVRDKVTGLQWMRCSLGQTWQARTRTCSGVAGRFNYSQARALPMLMNQAGGYAGYTDWRLLTVEELRTLVFCSSGHGFAALFCDDNSHHPTIVTQAFPNTPIDSFWSGSPGASNSGSAWGVSFGYGGAGSDGRGVNGRVRLVRGGQ